MPHFPSEYSQIPTMAKRAYTTWSFYFIASLISFPKTLPTTYSAPVTQTFLLFLHCVRLAAASGLRIGCSLSQNCSFQDIWWQSSHLLCSSEAFSIKPTLTTVFKSVTPSPDPIPRVPLASSTFHFPHIVYQLITYHTIHFLMTCIVKCRSLCPGNGHMRADIFVYFVHQYIPSTN